MSTKVATPFGALLLRYRAAARLTQEQLAARAGVSPDAITALERGKRRTPRAATIELLASALGLDDDQRADLLAAAQASLAASAAPPTADDVEVLSATAIHLPPVSPTPLIGRTGEMETIIRLLARDRVRLLTLTGPAGVGKTRLALAVAPRLLEDRERFPAGIAVVDLTPVHDPALVLGAIARGLGLLESGNMPLMQCLVEALKGQQQLIVLDNFEQVLPAAASLGTLLAACSGLSLLVTSRIPLHLRWEHILRIAPLPVPDLSAPLPPLAELAAIPSVALFLLRAHSHQADFVLTAQQAAYIAQLVAQLDGLPLAIELAAARLDVLPLSGIVQRLHDRLHLLQWDAQDLPERQRSLEATVRWSYELLSAEEQRWFRHLGVFTGRVTLEAMAAIVSYDEEDSAPDETRALQVLTSLAEKSLVLRRGEAEDEAGQLAFGMLETVREFAREQLMRQGEWETALRAHAHYFLALAQQAVPFLHTGEQRQWYMRLERDHDNLIAALQWLLAQEDPADREAAVRLAVALGEYWYLRGYSLDGQHLFEAALRCAADLELASTLRIQVLNLSGQVLRQQGKLDQAQTALDAALALAQQQHNQPGIATALYELGARAALAGDGERSIRLLREALQQWRALGDQALISLALLTLGAASQIQGKYQEALSYYPDALSGYLALGNTYFASLAEYGLAASFQGLGDLLQAVLPVQDGVRMSLTFADRGGLSAGAEATLWLLHSVADAGDPVLCARLLGARDSLSRTIDPLTSVWVPGLSRHLKTLRERIESEGLSAAYREGRSRSFEEIGALLTQVLRDLAQTLAQTDAADGATRQVTAARHASVNLLSEREQQVLQLVAQGLTNKAIAEQLIISPSTVRYHLTMLFNKLGVDTRAQAVAVAIERGLL